MYEKQDGTLIKDFTDDIAIKSNADFSLLGFSISPLDAGAGLNHVSVRYSHLYKHVLKLGSDEQFAIYFNDNFAGLDRNRFYAVGFSLE